MKLEINKLYKFIGPVHFGQDMGFYHGKLPDIIFQYLGPVGDTYRFIADGFGCTKNGEYGNGAIYIYDEESLQNIRKVE